MLTISEPKVAGFVPRWSPFPGFSLLFDAPPSAYRLEGGLEELHCDVSADSPLAFYRHARRTLEGFGLAPLLNTYLFCALPPESYHVTAFDVANQADLTRCKGESIESLRELLTAPIDADRFSHPILAEASASVLSHRRWDLAFRFGKLMIGGRVMAIQLAPFGPDDAKRLAEFVDARGELHRAYLHQFGIGAKLNFTPHVSLGYFANAEGAELARAQLPQWNEAMQTAIGDLPLPFETVSMHGFRSMAEFFRSPVGKTPDKG